MIRKACVTAVLAASLASPAWADSFSLGVVNPVVSQTVFYTRDGLRDDFSFKIASGDWVQIDFQGFPEDGKSLPLIDFKLSLSDPLTEYDSWHGTTSNFRSFTSFDLVAGTEYVVNVYGGLSLPTGGSYELTLSIGQTAPVPEPETYAMLLAGLGLLGLAKRRRQKLNA